jgi:(2Fe-2S) ferredoxin
MSDEPEGDSPMAKKPKIHVCERGKHCCKRGGEEVYKAIKRELKAQDLKGDIKLESEKCMGLCSTGPTVIVTPGGIQYGGVTPEDAAELVRVTASGGEPIERLLARHQKKKKKKD